jgi:NADPH:quinone reductase-like Zn-dependent oxidoreductase
LRKANIQRGDRVLVIGASGAVGTAAVQIAKYFGAHVTGVCGSSNIELVRSIGADDVIDYTKEDFASASDAFDVIVDTTGTAPFARCENALKRRGRLLVVLDKLALGSKRPSKASGKKVIAGVSRGTLDDMKLLGELAAAGTFKPVIDRSYPLANVAEAHAHVDGGHKRGSVVLTVHSVRSSTSHA